MLTWNIKTETKTTNAHFILLYFVFPNSFVFSCFNSSILYSVQFFDIWWSFYQFKYFRMFCCKHLITFENIYQPSCWFHCVDVFYIKFRLFETYKAANYVTEKLLIETLSNFRTTKEVRCWFKLYFHMYS